MNSIRNAVAAAALATVICFGSASAYMVAEPVTNPSNHNNYSLVTASQGQTLTWDYANQLAASSGGHLVSIETAAEGQWVLDNFSAGGTRAIYINTAGRTIGAMPHYGVEFVAVIEREAPAPSPRLVSPTPVGFNGHSYFLLTASTWLQAQAKATSMGLALGRPTHLVRIDSDAERAFVMAQFAATRRVWIDGVGRFVGPSVLSASGLVEVDADLGTDPISLPPADAGLMSSTSQVDLFAGVGADVTPVAKDAPVATKKISWGDLKARYR